MKKRTNKDVIELITNLKRGLDNKPSTSKMYKEIQMMKFKIRPVQGNLTEVNFNNDKFIETLWSLGKLEEFYQREYHQLDKKNRDLFLKIFDSIYEKYQQDLNKIHLHREKHLKNQGLLEVEIFKEIKTKKIN